MLFQELRQRRLDLIILLTFDDPVTADDIVSEALYEDRIVVVAAVNQLLTRRRRIELADLVNENWTLPDSGHPVAKIVAEGFRANGLEAPRVTVTTAPCRLRDTLLTTGRFLTVAQESALHFTPLSALKVLPVELPGGRGTTRIMTLKNRALSPVAQLFIEHAQEVATLLAKRQ